MSTFEASDFPAFFQAVNGFAPFPWQQELALQLCSHSDDPRVLDLPTGTGKTACIEIAVFHLAFELAHGVKPRTAPMRIIWIVDRRLIVDEAYDRAAHLARCLDDPEAAPIVRAVGSALRNLGGGENASALVVQRLRGGIPREGDWTRSPAQPTFVSSTVDQVGSRLLFRGYGVRPRMWPIHAGLLGEDAALYLDEVHLSNPFRETLETISAQKRTLELPWVVRQLSATPRLSPSRGDTAFGLTASDYSNAVLSPRLKRPKPATLHPLGALRFGGVEHAEAFAREAVRLSAEGENPNGHYVLVIVNRVELARQVHEQLLKILELRGDPLLVAQEHIIRLVGRARDVDKDELRKQLLSWVHSKNSSKRETPQRPRFVVATQTIEAGADVDFDALVTQVAPLASLRQRFGRLNRMGRDIEARASILATNAETAKSAKPDPVYGDACRSTWLWLNERALGTGGTINFANDGFAKPAEPQLLEAPSASAPILMPAHLDALSRTEPAPLWSPDPSLYLHGSPRSVADVSLIWRADLPDPMSSDDAALADALVSVVGTVLAAVPPRPNEALPQTIGAVKRWLRGERAGDSVDLEIDIITDESEVNDAKSRLVWRYNGTDEDPEIIAAEKVRPGDTLVIPASYGGCDGFGWNPKSGQVSDVARNASLHFRDRSFALRFHRELFAQAQRDEASATGIERPSDETLAREWRVIASFLMDRVDLPARRLLRELEEQADTLGLPESWNRDIGDLLASSGRLTRLVPFLDVEDADEMRDVFIIIVAPRGIGSATSKVRWPRRSSFESATESDELGSSGVGALELLQHSRDVQTRARATAAFLQMPDVMVDDLALAGFLHDLGKWDERFQHYLGFYDDKVFAKSGVRRSPKSETAAWEAAGLPEGWRHEALSVRIAQVHPAFADAHDRGLVLWLIGTHHGYGRPSFPHCDPWDRNDRTISRIGLTEPLPLPAGFGPQSLNFAVDGAGPESGVDWQTLRAELHDRYGVWALALLEAIVRLADHRASEEPAHGVRNEQVHV